MRRITPHRLWIGHAGDSRAFRGLFDQNIRAVVQLAVEESPLVLPRELALFRVPLADGGGNDQGLLRLAVRTVTELVTTRVPSLVCCGAGMSRSPAIVAAALSIIEDVHPERCLERVTAGFPADVSPALWQEVMIVLGKQ